MLIEKGIGGIHSGTWIVLLSVIWVIFPVIHTFRSREYKGVSVKDCWIQMKS